MPAALATSSESLQNPGCAGTRARLPLRNRAQQVECAPTPCVALVSISTFAHQVLTAPSASLDALFESLYHGLGKSFYEGKMHYQPRLLILALLALFGVAPSAD